MTGLRHKIESCCTNIENANSNEDIQKEVNEIRGCCNVIEPEKAEEIQSCCTNIERAESKDDIQKEVDSIRGCCSVM